MSLACRCEHASHRHSAINSSGVAGNLGRAETAQLLAHLPKANAYYWRTQAGAELDLLLFLKGRRIGIEIKRADAPTMTSSMVSAFQDLELHRLLVVYPGSTRYTLRSKVEVMSLAECVAELA